MLDAIGEQYAEGAIGVEHVLGVADPHGHRVAVALGDRLERGRLVEDAAPALPDRQADAHPRRLEVDYAARAIGTLVFLEPPL